MTEGEFQRISRDMALKAVVFVQALPRNAICQVLGKQLLRCSTSVGANYRSACRARSKPDMLAKLAIVEEEADECLYWLDLLVSANQCSKESSNELEDMADHILRMTVNSIRTLRSTSHVKELRDDEYGAVMACGPRKMIEELGIVIQPPSASRRISEDKAKSQKRKAQSASHNQ